jgi:hypothetical protein
MKHPSSVPAGLDLGEQGKPVDTRPPEAIRSAWLHSPRWRLRSGSPGPRASACTPPSPSPAWSHPWIALAFTILTLVVLIVVARAIWKALRQAAKWARGG